MSWIYSEMWTCLSACSGCARRRRRLAERGDAPALATLHPPWLCHLPYMVMEADGLGLLGTFLRENALCCLRKKKKHGPSARVCLCVCVCVCVFVCVCLHLLVF